MISQKDDHDLFLLLHDVARLARVAADKRARIDGMTRAQWILLLRLARSPGLSQKEAADLLEVEPISVARLVDRLEASGLIERRPDASDRRIWRLHLLAAAQPVLARVKTQRDALAALVEADLSPALREAMVEGLRQMKSNLSRLSKTVPADIIREIA